MEVFLTSIYSRSSVYQVRQCDKFLSCRTGVSVENRIHTNTISEYKYGSNNNKNQQQSSLELRSVVELTLSKGMYSNCLSLSPPLSHSRVVKREIGCTYATSLFQLKYALVALMSTLAMFLRVFFTGLARNCTR